MPLNLIKKLLIEHTHTFKFHLQICTVESAKKVLFNFRRKFAIFQLFTDQTAVFCSGRFVGSKWSSKMTTESNFYNTIIVGAGMAGSSTAYHLLCENNYKGKVLILEARNRIGGRVNGMTIAGKHVELGMYERYLINDLKFRRRKCY